MFECFTTIFCFFQESFPDECDTIFHDLVETDLGAIFHVLIEAGKRYNREKMMHNVFQTC